MALTIELDGLPDQVAAALAMTVAELKLQYEATKAPRVDRIELPTQPGSVIGSLSRSVIYEDR